MVLELCFLVNIFGSKGFTSPMTFCRRSNSRPGFNAVPSMASHTGITLTISMEIRAGKPAAELKANECRDSRWDFITPLSVVYPVWKRFEELDRTSQNQKMYGTLLPRPFQCRQNQGL